MADLLANFAYCSLIADVDAVTTSFPVDECGRLPSAAQLAANDFWMTVESTYADGAFEIIKVTNKGATSGPGALTVVRGQEGTPAVGHTSGTYVKQSLTAGIMARFLNFAGRQTTTYTTAVLAAGATEIGLITLAKSYRLLSIQTSIPARVRIYSSAAARTADAARATTADPTTPGVMLDYLTVNAVTQTLSPLVDGVNAEAVPSSAIPISITPTGTGAVTVFLTYVRTE